MMKTGGAADRPLSETLSAREFAVPRLIGSGRTAGGTADLIRYFIEPGVSCESSAGFA